MKNEIDRYVEDVNLMISFRNKIKNNEISSSQEDISAFLKSFRFYLKEASEKADYYLNQDLSDVSVVTLKDLQKTFEAWGSWGFKGKSKPLDVVEKVKEELMKRDNN